MNTKYLFGMLFGGAMLAACSAEDDFNLSKTPEVNTSAPVFTVSFDDNGVLKTRATFKENWHVGFDETDNLSLFHGITAPSTTLASWQNAVYNGGEDEDGIFKFTTKSLVNPGYAVMIYPADTEFNNVLSSNLGASAPAIIIPAVQNDKTKEKTPYMSEILNIDNTDGAGKPGYGNEYDIALKRVGSTLSLTLNQTPSEKLDNAIEATGVPAIEITSVELDGGNQKFTTAILVKADNEISDDEVHTSWAYVSELDVQTTSITLNNDLEAQSRTLSTTDLKDGVATFTMLPTLSSSDVTVTGGKVIVYTTYGTVEIADADGEDAWNGKQTISEGLTALMSSKALWAPAKSGKFEGENVGGHLSRTLDVDMSKLKMDGLHVDTDEKLVNALKVFNAYSTEEEVTFYLDGDEDNNKFTISAERLDEVQKLNAEGKVTLAPCQKEALCTTVQIVNGGDEKEVPNLAFGTPGVSVELDGAWMYTTVVDNKTFKKFENVKDITILKTLTLKNTIAASGTTKFIVAKDAKVDVSGVVLLQISMENNGTINIPEGVENRLAVDADTELTNNEATGKKIDAFSKGGTINNGSVLAIVDGTNGVINNYGEIILKTKEARTLITANQRTGAEVDNPFASGTNAIGSIVLYDKDGGNNNTVVKTANAQGFIKLELKNDKVGSDETGTIANYIILAGNCTSVNETNQKGLMKDEKGTVGNIKYIEIQSSKEVVFGNATQTKDKYGKLLLDALIIPAGKSVNIPQGVEIEINKALYVKGTVTKAGTFEYGTKYKGHYFGGADADKNNIFSTGAN